jgi:hypothetical protein
MTSATANIEKIGVGEYTVKIKNKNNTNKSNKPNKNNTANLKAKLSKTAQSSPTMANMPSGKNSIVKPLPSNSSESNNNLRPANSAGTPAAGTPAGNSNGMTALSAKVLANNAKNRIPFLPNKPRRSPRLSTRKVSSNANGKTRNSASASQNSTAIIKRALERIGKKPSKL